MRIFLFSDEKVRREASGILRRQEQRIDDETNDGGSFEEASRYFSEKVFCLFLFGLKHNYNLYFFL